MTGTTCPACGTPVRASDNGPVCTGGDKGTCPDPFVTQAAVFQRINRSAW